MKRTKKLAILFLLALISAHVLAACKPKDPEKVTMEIRVEADESLTKTMYVYFGDKQIGSLTAGGSFWEKVEAVKDGAYDIRVSDNDPYEGSYSQVIVRADENKTLQFRVSMDDVGFVNIQKVVSAPSSTKPL